MGRKRQRSSGATGTAPSGPEKTPSRVEQPTAKKQKKTLQLKVIGVKKPSIEPPKPAAAAAAPAAEKSSAVTDSELKSKKKKKKKKANKNKADESSASSAVKGESKANESGPADIDDLFQSLKTKKQASEKAAELKKREEELQKRKARKEREQLDDQIKRLEAQNTNVTAMQGQNPDPRPVRYDEDGLPIYTEASLQIGKGGDTADSPSTRVDPMELRAFGLEDRADAVISAAASSWSLGQLSQWREQVLCVATPAGDATAARKHSQEFLRQRQRGFRQQMLRATAPRHQAPAGHECM
ncbi:hypothetical protein P43SY_001379 [Pythium insidiosum]|uniref:Uncharacterized protein n=1 Tax=Pythium insidiosum TaxID=114742 RepID=A0AAD5LPS3_PYTIN|nr:hypothetical protein P43SY_001379 [Pythium insidiosum]